MFKVSDKVKDLKYPNRPGGIVTEVYAQGINVNMTFEDGHIGCCSFSLETAKKELELIKGKDNV